MRPDGSITFKTTIDNADVAKELDETKREIERSQKDIAKTEAAKLPMVEEAKKLGVELDRAKEKLYTLQKQQEMAAQALTGTDPGTYADAAAAKPALDAAVADQQKDVDTLQSKWDKVNDKIDQYDQKITQATAALEGQTAKAGELSAQLTKGGIDMSGAIEKAQKSAERFKKRLASIASQAFVFTLISKALKNIVKYLGKVLKSNEQYTSELARLKGALLTAFQPIYEILLPSLLGLLQVATKVATVIARIASILSGKSASQNAKNAQALYDEANAIEEVGEASKQAKKSLSGFDEINQLGDNTDDREISAWSETSASADFSAFRTDEYKQKIDALAAILSGALLVLGAILAFSGANIPLGIGLMVVGAIGLAAEASANWGAIVEALQGPIGAVVAIGSALLLVIGLILAFTGTAIPLGIGLIAVGAAGLATAAAVNWGTIVDALRGPIGGIVALASTALLAIGIILVCAGVGLPLGIGLIAVGAAGLATTAAINWNKIIDSLRGPIGGIVAIASGALLALGIILVCAGMLPLGIALIAAGSAGLVTVTALNWNALGDAIGNAFKNAINGVIKLINGFIGWLNDIFHIEWNALVIAGVEVIPAVDYQILSFGTIPYLAQGAVIPPNREFMAVLGDQKHGTNVEAPLSTIQEAVSAVMAGYEASNLAGHEATVAVLREILEAILGIQIGDDVIGQAVNRYNQRMAVIKGGL